MLFLVRRFDAPDGKVFLPLSYCTLSNGDRRWRWTGLQKPRPLYNLHDLAKQPELPVIVCEGEKSAEAAARLLPDHIVTTSPNGSNGAGSADWSPLRDRGVLIWPDADEPGLQYAHAAARQAFQSGASSVRILELPPGLPCGFDAADAEEQTWSSMKIRKLIESAVAFEQEDNDGAVVSASNETTGRSKERRRSPQRNQLLDLIDDDFQFWHDNQREKFVTFPVGGHFEHAQIRSASFRDYLAGLFYEKNLTPIGDASLTDALRVMSAWAAGGENFETHVRIAAMHDCIYIDLADPEWRCVCINRDGWSVGKFADLKFLRPSSSKPLPEPVHGGSIHDVKELFGNVDDRDFILLAAWLLGALRPDGPYPLLAVSGEQGSGKSSLTDFLANLVDPEIGKRRPVSRDERDLIISAKNAHTLLYDNLSGIAAWFSDALCRLSTGGGFQTRKLHSDDEQLVLQAQRPVVCNGIPDLTSRADLADRTIAIDLPRIDPGQRLTERAIRRKIELLSPGILGALFNAVSRGLRNIDNITLINPPRMADFCEWVIACLPEWGWAEEDFLTAYRDNRSGANRAALDADPVAQEIIRVVREHRPTGFTGTASQLLGLLNDFANASSIHLRIWPRTAAAMGQQLRRCSPLLRTEGFEVSQSRSAEGRSVSIRPST